MEKRIRSRIHQYLSQKVLDDLYKICDDKLMEDNNQKVEAVLKALHFHNIDFVELGPGTNRLAILIDNYVFKIALDKWGIRDNLNEFTTSKELQPFVVKTYETNELITVCEYVTVISKEEFVESKETIQRMLSIISEGYLLGDVGTVMKNFANWGYRDDGELVILDYAYIHRIHGDEILCIYDGAMLDYDMNFHNLICPKCKKKYTFMDIRRKIPMELERGENELAKEHAYKLNNAVQVFAVNAEDDDEDEVEVIPSLFDSEEHTNNNNIKEEEDMSEKDLFELNTAIDNDSAFEDALEQLQLMKKANLIQITPEEETECEQESVANVIKVHRETEDEVSDITIINRQKTEDEKAAIEDAIESVDEISDLLGEIEEEISEVQEKQEPLTTDQIMTMGHGFITESDEGETLKDGSEVIVQGTLVSEDDDPFVQSMKAHMTGDITVEDTNQDGSPDKITVEAHIEEVSEGTDIEPKEITEVDAEVIEVEPRQDEEEEIDPMEEVLLDRTIHIGDNLEIHDKVTAKINTNSDEEAEKIRQELSLEDNTDDGDEIDDERLNALAADFLHLEDEADDAYKIDKSWK